MLHREPCGSFGEATAPGAAQIEGRLWAESATDLATSGVGPAAPPQVRSEPLPAIALV